MSNYLLGPTLPPDHARLCLRDDTERTAFAADGPTTVA
jgi:hypothetical protein